MLLNWAVPMNRALDEWLANDVETQESGIRPAIDMTDDGDVFRIVMEMPGVGKDGLEIELKDDVLRVRGTRSKLAESQKFLMNGRQATRPFERSFTLGKDVEREHIKARLEDGLLTITLPRRAAVKPQRVEIEVG